MSKTSTYKILGQVAPLATTETDLYTVPASTQAVVSKIVVCNRGAKTTYRVSVSVGGGATANKDYLAYDHDLLVADRMEICAGMTLGAGDKVRVYAGTGDLSFQIFGAEIA